MMKKIFYIFLLIPFCIDGLAQSMVPKSPKLNLDSYILLEASTNTVIAEYNSDIQISPASMTKVMTGYVIADQMASSGAGVLMARSVEFGRRYNVPIIVKSTFTNNEGDRKSVV